MRNWIHGPILDGNRGDQGGAGKKDRVAVVHCKAGKGRSGTAACSYLISEEGWHRADALRRFTERRMRVGFGSGVSIPSQLRWVGYVDRWTNQMNKQYVERPVEIVELHVLGLRDGVKVGVEGFVDNGLRIHVFHLFSKDEKIVLNDEQPTVKRMESSDVISPSSSSSLPAAETASAADSKTPDPSSSMPSCPGDPTSVITGGATVLLKPSRPIVLQTSDVNIDFERRNKAAYTGWTMVTSVAHVWFNAYFEGGHDGADSGVFEIDWEAMDGIKGSASKGSKALDSLKVVWRYAARDEATMQSLRRSSSSQP